MKYFFKYMLVLFLLASCSKRNITYFSNLELQKGELYTTTNAIDPIRIQKGDELEIKVTTLDPESNLLFNYGVISNGDEVLGSRTTYTQSRYKVSENGEIDFPIVGKIELLGLTRDEAREKIASSLEKLVTNPRVELTITNFKITVLGEVNQPNTFTITTDNITVIEALGLAGDMTVYGKRENVLVIRERGGEKMLYRIDMNDKELLGSANFFLKQNDVLYIEADKKKLIQAEMNPTTIAVMTILSSVAVALIFNYQNIF
ncbi:polysaccharide biosynthesis/export family protein [Algoriphagus lutimaris]|uniref:polysaccharide biosynthesis/export family protein n=1 Tax=Algoriphagus lutimaris TaxID=613197 RepID=UPI00196A5E89|nr:polysaccharide biosynthesis/export family protein [Algoriphagus lutimaris]MBN3518772.1 polysaccharide biosynthesis/export family protein [Algoriphagus lutimaris]